MDIYVDRSEGKFYPVLIRNIILLLAREQKSLKIILDLLTYRLG